MTKPIAQRTIFVQEPVVLYAFYWKGEGFAFRSPKELGRKAGMLMLLEALEGLDLEVADRTYKDYFGNSVKTGDIVKLRLGEVSEVEVYKVKLDCCEYLVHLRLDEKELYEKTYRFVSDPQELNEDEWKLFKQGLFEAFARMAKQLRAGLGQAIAGLIEPSF